jgi:hypothetical protein
MLTGMLFDCSVMFQYLRLQSKKTFISKNLDSARGRQRQDAHLDYPVTLEEERTKQRLEERIFLCTIERIYTARNAVFPKLHDTAKETQRKALWVATMIQVVVDVEMDLLKSLQFDKHASKIGSWQLHTFLHWVMDDGTGSMRQFLHIRCQPSSLVTSVPTWASNSASRASGRRDLASLLDQPWVMARRLKFVINVALVSCSKPNWAK